MVWKKYEDQTIDEALQNRFTGYLQSAVRRQRAAYIDKLNHLKYFVNADLSNVEDISYDLEDEVLKSFPLHLQIEHKFVNSLPLRLSACSLSNTSVIS